MIKFLFIVLIIGLSTSQTDSIEKKNINTLTFRKGQYTTGRRTHPIPQLSCVTPNVQFTPSVVQCENKGMNDRGSFEWKCEAELPEEYSFGNLEVNCEGYNYPGDSKILIGSCALTYELNYNPTRIEENIQQIKEEKIRNSRTNQRKRQEVHYRTDSHSYENTNYVHRDMDNSSTSLFGVILVGIIVMGMIYVCCGLRVRRKKRRTRGFENRNQQFDNNARNIPNQQNFRNNEPSTFPINPNYNPNPNINQENIYPDAPTFEDNNDYQYRNHHQQQKTQTVHHHHYTNNQQTGNRFGEGLRNVGTGILIGSAINSSLRNRNTNRIPVRTVYNNPQRENDSSSSNSNSNITKTTTIKSTKLKRKVGFAGTKTR